MVDRDRSEGAGTIPGCSWLVSAVGLALVVGSAGFMLFRAFIGDFPPPELTIETDAVMANGSGYLVPIRVMNRGGSVAAGVAIEGILKDGTAAVETIAIAIDYVPAGSQRRAGLIFSRDPRKFDLQVRATGFELP